MFIGLLVAISLLAELARRLGLPYPVFMVLSGLALGFVPGLPAPTLDPGTFFFFFLPPLVYSEAFVYSTDDLRAHGLAIFLLAVGLVLATALAVAAIAHAAFDLPWAAALVLGAVVGPTDPVSATTVLRRLGVGGPTARILEGEALINDATALVIYRLAVGSAGAAVSLGHTVAEIVWVTAGGVAVGAAVAWVWTRTRRWLSDPEVQITFSLATPFAAYFPAERLGVSGVLAAVTAGLMVGRQAHTLSPGTRLRREAFWEVLVFQLNAALFLLMGLTFPEVLHRLGDVSTGDLIWHAVVLAATVVALRFAWMFLMIPALPGIDDARGRPPLGRLIVLGWCGMRGGVSLAAAMAIPVAAGGQPFPARDEIVFLTYMVVLATLVVPGLTLGPLIRRLQVSDAEAQRRRDERARAHILRAALEHIDELAQNDELPDEIARQLREIYESRLNGLVSVPTADMERSDAGLRARRDVIAAQRAALAELEDSDRIGSGAAREIERDLELEQSEY